MREVGDMQTTPTTMQNRFGRDVSADDTARHISISASERQDHRQCELHLPNSEFVLLYTPGLWSPLQRCQTATDSHRAPSLYAMPRADSQNLHPVPTPRDIYLHRSTVIITDAHGNHSDADVVKLHKRQGSMDICKTHSGGLRRKHGGRR